MSSIPSFLKGSTIVEDDRKLGGNNIILENWGAVLLPMGQWDNGIMG